MISFDYTIKDSVGFHARPCGAFVKAARRFSSKTTVIFGEKRVEATRLMQLMALCAKCGDTLSFEICGDDEKTAAEELKKFLSENM